MNYTTSRDYDLLIHLMQSGHRLVCFVNYCFPSDKPGEPPCRDVCRTRYEPPRKNPEEHYFAAQCRGICYAGGYHMTPEQIKKDCQAVELEFILPTLPLPPSDLFACPFCGGAYISDHPNMMHKGRFTSVPMLEELADGGWRVCCYGCGVQTWNNLGYTKEQAIAAWNTRSQANIPTVPTRAATPPDPAASSADPAA